MNENPMSAGPETGLRWFKSSYSDGAGNNCVEVALARLVHIRDSKDRARVPVRVHPAAWSAFVSAASGSHTADAI
ncbi:DUF397 domain-containing protein [Streptomyces sp. Isolate_45]|uniref:DUF397 domain-containing protein n=1 Tax=Streptomyces sp. Isolate_45 TaxID=2950111 RepID=UPI002481BFDF|nr:DUF397 domain-containing protein [Streptomyces sp. Isolate_45]MDA5281040.1 DUF397 domain-containing protein [Streptomyces sp. Isolate_45]